MDIVARASEGVCGRAVDDGMTRFQILDTDKVLARSSCDLNCVDVERVDLIPVENGAAI